MNRHWFFKLLIASLLAIVLLGPALQVKSQNKAFSNEIIEITLWIDQVYDFSMTDKTYNVHGSLALNYTQFIQDKLKESDQIAGANIIDLVKFENMIEPWNSSFTPIYGAPLILADGRLSQVYNFSATFYAKQINYKDYPFGSLRLVINLQPRINAYSYLGRDLALKVASSGNGLNGIEDLHGFQPNSWRFRNLTNQRETRLGAFQEKTFESIMFEIYYKIETFSLIMNLLLPLLIVMLLMLLAPCLRSSLCSDRLAIPPVVMLTVAFLHQAYRESLPNLPYLTFFDGLYLHSYVVILAFFVLFIWASNCIDRVDIQNRDLLVNRISKLDLRLQLVSITSYILITLFALWRF